ncbi:MAG: SPOR domain-containing protein [Rubrivivax sp.]|nr:SPOR domain-containing protein [Rubrivivax sp.]
MKFERGGFAMGLVAGLLIGLALALGVALYITKAPVPFVNKVPQRTAEQDSAETERNRNWDPNAGLNKSAGRAASAAGAMGAGLPPGPPVAAPGPAVTMPMPAPTAPAMAASAAAPVGRPAPRDPAAILSGAALPSPSSPNSPTPSQSTAMAADAFVYFVQAGAFTRSDDAEQQRARLALMGQAARITEREQAGRTVYRVRLGPYPTRNEAEALQGRLQEQGIEVQIVRVEKS